MSETRKCYSTDPGMMVTQRKESPTGEDMIEFSAERIKLIRTEASIPNTLVMSNNG
jgi:hypothetical protein